MPDDVMSQALALSTTATQRLAEIDRASYHMRLISFNALIEAARAGEVGVGFAVVADEVKAYSQRIEGEIASLQRDLDERVAGIRAAGDRQRAELAALHGRPGPQPDRDHRSQPV